jgi:ABC-2 type transport system ATP-binding protein
MWAVETTELTKDYRTGSWRKRSRRALDGLTLAVDRGEIFGLLGPNGAGKTTTLKLLLRLIFPTSGYAAILGLPVSDVRSHARLGYLPENPSFYDHLTAAEFMHYAGWLAGLPERTRRLRAAELLERVGLTGSTGVAVRKFSKGMVQRLGIAQALIHDPELLILDEPMSGLDPLGRRQVRDLILELRRQGKTVLFSTHILADAEALCDRVAVLDRGRLQGQGSLREILRAATAATELILDDPAPPILDALATFASTTVRTGDHVRLELRADAEVAAALRTALNAGARIVALNPVKVSLEDYFMERLKGREHADSSQVEARRR